MRRRLLFWGAVSFNVGVLGFNVIWQDAFTWFNGILLFNIAFLFLMHSTMARFLNELRSLSGKSGAKENSEADIKTYLIDTRGFVDEAHLAIAGINEIGQEQFAGRVQNIKNESIRTSLLTANQKIIDLRKKEQENNWITQGVAAIAELKQKGNDIGEYAYQVISIVAKYLRANQGGFFMLKSENENQYFELTATYAYGKKRFVEKRINAGDGLIGQMVYEKDIIYLTDVPKDYVKITSGLGEALPRCVCIVPLMSEGKILGAFEIASFEKLRPSEMEYLKKISETISYNLGSIETHTQTEILLGESQKMAQEVKAQEEELRQNMEELTATQEQMRRKQTETDAVMSSLSTVELDLNGNILQANEIFLGVTGYSLGDIQGKLYKSLIPQHGNDPIQYEMMWSSILSGRSFSGEFRIVNKAQKEMCIAGNFTPIAGESGHPYKVMVISFFTTQDKEKLSELQETVAAMKNCFPIAEINPDLTFKSANDLFLMELGIKRLELKKSLPKNVLANGSFKKVEKYLQDMQEQPDNVVLDILDKNGVTKSFNSTLIKINNTADNRKRGLLILRNPI